MELKLNVFQFIHIVELFVYKVMVSTCICVCLRKIQEKVFGLEFSKFIHHHPLKSGVLHVD